jgi:limonene-1,2-epoxide hydrolase
MMVLITGGGVINSVHANASEQNNIDVVKSFINAVEAKDKNRILAYFRKDSVLHNMPQSPVTGPDAIWEKLAVVLDVSDGVKWDVKNIALGNNGNVLTERTDRYLINNQWAEFKVMGIFEINDGKIVSWREYFDLQQALAEMDRVGEPVAP